MKRAARAYDDDWSDDYLAWLTTLEDDVVIAEFGYERGEFTVYPESWATLYAEGLSPRDAWQRALDAHGERRREDEEAKAANWARIQREDAELLLCVAIASFGSFPATAQLDQTEISRERRSLQYSHRPRLSARA